MEIQEQPVMQATEEMDNLLWPQESEAAVEALQPQATEVRAEVEALMVPEAAVAELLEMAIPQEEEVMEPMESASLQLIFKINH